MWNFSRGICPTRYLRAVRIVPEGTPGAVEAWVDYLERYEVWLHGPGDDAEFPVLVGFSDSPETSYAGERRVDRWKIAEILDLEWCACNGRCRLCAPRS